MRQHYLFNFSIFEKYRRKNDFLRKKVKKKKSFWILLLEDCLVGNFFSVWLPQLTCNRVTLRRTEVHSCEIFHHLGCVQKSVKNRGGGEVGKFLSPSLKKLYFHDKQKNKNGSLQETFSSKHTSRKTPIVLGTILTKKIKFSKANFIFLNFFIETCPREQSSSFMRGNYSLFRVVCIFGGCFGGGRKFHWGAIKFSIITNISTNISACNRPKIYGIL